MNWHVHYGILYCYIVDIVHRDLKLENILVHRNEESGDLHIKVMYLPSP